MVRQSTNVNFFHFLAHRLELEFMDSDKGHPMFKEIIKLSKEIYKLYHRIPKLLRELRGIAVIMNEAVIHFIAIINIRWVASKRKSFYCIVS